MENVIKTPAILSGFNRKVDNSMSYRFVGTLESSKGDREIADDLFQQPGWLIFVANEEEIDEIPIPDEKAPTDEGLKTPSERLRGVKYAYFIQSGGEKEKFNRWFTAWRDKWIEREIDLTKEKLNS